jgi:hypothetical protein
VIRPVGVMPFASFLPVEASASSASVTKDPPTTLNQTSIVDPHGLRDKRRYAAVDIVPHDKSAVNLSSNCIPTEA